MTKKILLDVDPGIDDAVALCLALFDPQLEVVAVTAVAGNVPPDQATRNVQAIIEQLDPPRWPRIGEATMPELGLPTRSVQLHGADGLGNAQFQVSRAAASPSFGEGDLRRGSRGAGRVDDRGPGPTDEYRPRFRPRSRRCPSWWASS